VQDPLLIVLAEFDLVTLHITLQFADEGLPPARTANWTHQLLEIAIRKLNAHCLIPIAILRELRAKITTTFLREWLP
jgi:hypothetical protein